MLVLLISIEKRHKLSILATYNCVDLCCSWKAPRRTLWVNSFMQSLLQKVLFYLCLRPMNKEDKMIPSAAVTA